MQQSLSKVTERLSIELFIYLLYMRIIMGVAQCNGCLLYTSGLVEVTREDCLANVPFVEGCGLWFDHHSSEEERNAYKGKYRGESRTSPSCAHIIYDYYGGRERFPGYDDLLEAVDKVDSANLSIEEVLHPKDVYKRQYKNCRQY